MPSDAEYLVTARSNYCRSLAELSDPLARKVSYSIGGRSMSWTEYQRFLLDGIKAIDEQIAYAAIGIGSDEVISVMVDAGPGGRYGP